MCKKKNAVVMLVTNDRRNQMVKAIFADSKSHLNATEMQVFDMVQNYPELWSCGCVIGIPEHQFTFKERSLLQQHGLNKHFKQWVLYGFVF